MPTISDEKKRTPHQQIADRLLLPPKCLESETLSDLRCVNIESSHPRVGVMKLSAIAADRMLDLLGLVEQRDQLGNRNLPLAVRSVGISAANLYDKCVDALTSSDQRLNLPADPSGENLRLRVIEARNMAQVASLYRVPLSFNPVLKN